MYNLETAAKRLAQKKERLKKTEAGYKKLLLKQRNDRIWKHGCFIEKAGLETLDDKTLMGALLTIKNNIENSKTQKEWFNVGEQFLASTTLKQDKGQPFEISFKDDLPNEIKKTLRNNGFKFNSFRKAWEGRGSKQELEELFMPYGGKIIEIQ